MLDTRPGFEEVVLPYVGMLLQVRGQPPDNSPFAPPGSRNRSFLNGQEFPPGLDLFETKGVTPAVEKLTCATHGLDMAFSRSGEVLVLAERCSSERQKSG